MSLQLISISCCDNKSWTISVCPFKDETINGVLLNIEIKFQKWLKNWILCKMKFECNWKIWFELYQKK